jgi:hypothetical protein
MANSVYALACLAQFCTILKVGVDPFYWKFTDEAQITGAPDHTAHPIAASQQRFGQVGTKESICSCDQDQFLTSSQSTIPLTGCLPADAVCSVSRLAYRTEAKMQTP